MISMVAMDGYHSSHDCNGCHDYHVPTIKLFFLLQQNMKKQRKKKYRKKWIVLIWIVKFQNKY